MTKEPRQTANLCYKCGYLGPPMREAKKKKGKKMKKTLNKEK